MNVAISSREPGTIRRMKILAPPPVTPLSDKRAEAYLGAFAEGTDQASPGWTRLGFRPLRRSGSEQQ